LCPYSLLFYSPCATPVPPSFPTRRSSDLMGLNQPLPVQFGIFVTNLAQGDLGRSLVARAPVSDLVRQRLPLTLGLVAYAMALALDRKSTRLNSSHEWISYAVFCLKQKT